jgi:hypothetical protein
MTRSSRDAGGSRRFLRCSAAERRFVVAWDASPRYPVERCGGSRGATKGLGSHRSAHRRSATATPLVAPHLGPAPEAIPRRRSATATPHVAHPPRAGARGYHTPSLRDCHSAGRNPPRACARGYPTPSLRDEERSGPEMCCGFVTENHRQPDGRFVTEYHPRENDAAVSALPLRDRRKSLKPPYCSCYRSRRRQREPAAERRFVVAWDASPRYPVERCGGSRGATKGLGSHRSAHRRSATATPHVAPPPRTGVRGCPTPSLRDCHSARRTPPRACARGYPTPSLRDCHAAHRCPTRIESKAWGRRTDPARQLPNAGSGCRR